MNFKKNKRLRIAREGESHFPWHTTALFIWLKLGRTQLQYQCIALVGLALLLTSGGCSFQQSTQEQRIGNLGYFEFQSPTDSRKGVLIGAPLWIGEAFTLLEDNDSQSESVVRLTDYGRIESLPSRKRQNGIVIGAPHGTFDEYTAELVNQVSYRTGLAAVIASGFTPTECAGWRINVNRPTERLYPSDSLEIHSKRARDVYQLFKQSVLEASRGNLNLYVDIHQNGRQKNIEVATVGISKAQARIIKETYLELRDRVLESYPDVTSVDLVIEPLDNIEIGAWAAKAQGILGVAKKSLHFEFPLYDTLGTSKARDSYTEIVTLLLDQTVLLLSKR